ncbi:BnaA02g22820D [Brassica napus]|uniref:BnaA02g22820D protein n=1 Tax=Brassica napus TaxID=3708 RepID=A0A078FKH0_BRANA|nr:BnaA02g22820D [Brassica napus]
MRATLDFHGFSGGFTTVRQFLSRCWSSSEMLQGVEKERFHMRIFLVPGWVNVL